jgi:hypothetical protein
LESTGIEAACENQDWRHTSARFQPPQTSDGTCQVFPYSATDPDQGYRFRRGHSASSSSPENEGKRIEFDDRENIEETGKDLPHLAYRVPSSTNVREVPTSPSWPFSLSRLDTAAPFLQEFIPAQDFHPELHQTLTRLWYDRQEAVRELGDALGKDDSARYTTLQSEVTVINTRMHTTLQHVVERFPHLINDGDSYSSRENNESSVQSLDPITAVSSRHIPTKSKEDPSLNEQIAHDARAPSEKSSGYEEGLNSSESGSGEDEERYLKADEWMETYESTWWNTMKKKPGKQSCKQDGQDMFHIQFSYQWMKSPRVMNDNMPVRSLFLMAVSYLHTEFGFIIHHVQDIGLIYQGQPLTKRGTLGSVPILDGAVIEIIYPRIPVNQTSGPVMPSNDRNGHTGRESGRLFSFCFLLAAYVWCRLVIYDDVCRQGRNWH